jgi:hypothetical protein
MSMWRLVLVILAALVGFASASAHAACCEAIGTPGVQGSVATGPMAAVDEKAEAGELHDRTGGVHPEVELAESDSPQRSPWRGSYVSLEGRTFNQSPAISSQARHGLSLVVQPEFVYQSANRRHRINATLFGRFWVEPKNRSADVREFNWEYRRDGWSLLAGMNRVFWGVTESRHVIDIINQSDMRESFAGDVKLGQLMVAASLQRPWGQLEVYALPGFRKRAFPPSVDRPRLQLPLAAAEVSESGPLDWAGRISISRNDADFHAYYFHGTSREPDLIPVFGESGEATAVKPLYRQIRQVGGDIQYAFGAWLFKGEVMHRSKENAHYQAGVGGFEYGISRLFGSASDIALLSEFQFDNRPDTEWPAPAARGIYAGMRLGVNDRASSEVKAGAVYDMKSHSLLVRAEFTRRLTNQWGLHLGYHGFSHVSKSPALRDFYRDSHLTISLRRYM